jgi:hypothetical protein
MALKDWKDPSWIGRGWTFKKGLNTLQISSINQNFYYVKVYTDVGWTSEKLDVIKSFNSLSKAQKYAKQYMRSH